MNVEILPFFGCTTYQLVLYIDFIRFRAPSSLGKQHKDPFLCNLFIVFSMFMCVSVCFLQSARNYINYAEYYEVLHES